MQDLIKQLEALRDIAKEIASEIEKKDNYDLIPELMNLLEIIIPNIFEVNNRLEILEREDIIIILDDIVNAYENKDAVLMTDVLRYGLDGVLEKILEAIKVER